MNKSNLVAEVATRTGLSRVRAAGAVTVLTDAIEDALVRGERVMLLGFGAFEVRHRAARKGHNVVTGQAIDVPAGKAPVFRASARLKALVASGKKP